MIAPVVIVALISIYYIAIGVIFAYMNGVPMLAKIIALVVPALLSGVAITVRQVPAEFITKRQIR